MKLMKLMLLVLLCQAMYFVSCDKIPQSGVINNFTNGITTTYRNIKPEDVIKVMNEEVVQHSNVVLGEDLQIISNKISGLTEKNGRVSVGGELTVSDQAGKVLLHVDDLFGPGQTFDRDSISFLRCTVSTGAPMKYNESYDVTIRYWDKFGDGELTNEFAMDIIDVP